MTTRACWALAYGRAASGSCDLQLQSQGALTDAQAATASATGRSRYCSVLVEARSATGGQRLARDMLPQVRGRCPTRSPRHPAGRAAPGYQRSPTDDPQLPHELILLPDREALTDEQSVLQFVAPSVARCFRDWALANERPTHP